MHRSLVGVLRSAQDSLPQDDNSKSHYPGAKSACTKRTAQSDDPYAPASSTLPVAVDGSRYKEISGYRR